MVNIYQKISYIYFTYAYIFVHFLKCSWFADLIDHLIHKYLKPYYIVQYVFKIHNSYWYTLHFISSFSICNILTIISMKLSG